MKGILQFDLPEESDEFDTATKAYDYRLILSDLDNHLRSLIKYPAESTSDSELYLLQALRDKLHQLCDDRKVEV